MSFLGDAAVDAAAQFFVSVAVEAAANSLCTSFVVDAAAFLGKALAGFRPSTTNRSF
jgi:hypothetical protein